MIENLPNDLGTPELNRRFHRDPRIIKARKEYREFVKHWPKQERTAWQRFVQVRDRALREMAESLIAA